MISSDLSTFVFQPLQLLPLLPLLLLVHLSNSQGPVKDMPDINTQLQIILKLLPLRTLVPLSLLLRVQ
jgi:hypothetical protein